MTIGKAATTNLPPLSTPNRTMDSPKYGRAIKLIRTAKGMSQQTLAEHLGVTPGYISLIEADKRAPRQEVIAAAAGVFGVPLVLLTFVASSGKGLEGVPPEAVESLGRELLRVLLEEEDVD